MWWVPDVGFSGASIHFLSDIHFPSLFCTCFHFRERAVTLAGGVVSDRALMDGHECQYVLICVNISV